jgi:nucleoside-diphosphate-sugar epimerase
MSDPRTIVLTGASGVIGQALLPALHGHEVICLVHRGDVPGASVVRCDVTESRLGLSQSEWEDLAARADCIIHSAAVTDWAEPNERFQQVNVLGTQQVLDLAAVAEAPVFHMSTSFVRALAPDAPRRLDRSNIIVNYVRSKIESDGLVEASGLPHVILRPTNVLGDSATGSIARNQIVQLVSEMLLRGKVPIFPAHPETKVDAIPQDTVADATRALVEAGEVDSTWWLTAGEQAMTIGRAVELCVEFAERIGRPVRPPELVPPDELDDAALADMSPMVRGFFARLVEFGHGLEACGTFPSSMDDLERRLGVEEPDWEGAYVRGLEHWAREKRFGAPAGTRT